MSEELKRCPFCGSNAAVIYESGHYTDKEGSHMLWTVCCGVCGVSYDGLSIDYEEVRKKWNRRAEL